MVEKEINKNRWKICLYCLSKFEGRLYFIAKNGYESGSVWKNPKDVACYARIIKTSDELSLCEECQYRFEHTIVGQDND